MSSLPQTNLRNISKYQPRLDRSQHKETASDPNRWNWDGPQSYTRITPGRYEAVAASVQGPEWCSSYQRWSLRLGFNLLACDGEVSRYFNGGRDKAKWKFGRMSEYFRWWCAANGELPKRNQSMDPSVFFEGQTFTVEVIDAKTNPDGGAKHDGEVYSRVTKLLGINGVMIPALSTQDSKLKTQDSRTHPLMHSPSQGGLSQGKGPQARKEKCNGCGLKLPVTAMTDHVCAAKSFAQAGRG